MQQIEFNEQIKCVQFCSTDLASNMLCIGFGSYLSLGTIHFVPKSNEIKYEEARRIHVNIDVPRAVSFSPKTTMGVTQNVLLSVCGGKELKVIWTDLEMEESMHNIEGHTSYINDVAWSYNEGVLASVSDDQTCKIWAEATNYSLGTTFGLMSAGVSVKWHPDDQEKVLVAEKRGVIQLINIRLKQAIISLESRKIPLMSADWAYSNRPFITALAAGDIFTWDLTMPCAPVNTKRVHQDGGRIVRFAPTSCELVVASIGRPGLTLKVFSAKSIVPLIEVQLKLYGGLAWHHRLPYLVAASDKKLYFWHVAMK